jgi:drug/metabolite transporter (DMT)-like permease
VPPIALAAVGCVIGCLVLGLAGLTGLVPFEVGPAEIEFFGGVVAWWVPVLIVGAFSTAFAYVAGIQAIRMLGTRLASFLGLSEVVFAAIVAWILIGEAIGPLQLLGGLLILGGIVLVRLERDQAKPPGGESAVDRDLMPTARP